MLILRILYYPLHRNPTSEYVELVLSRPGLGHSNEWLKNIFDNDCSALIDRHRQAEGKFVIVNRAHLQSLHCVCLLPSSRRFNTRRQTFI